MVRSGSFKNPKSLISCGSSRSIKMATRSPALGLNTVFNRRERLNGGKVSGTVSFVWAIIEKDFRTRTRVSQRIIRYRAGYRRRQKRLGDSAYGRAGRNV